MRNYYKVEFPVTRNMGTYSIIATESTMETKEENALWDYNKAREHDGLRPLDELPDGVIFTPLNNEEGEHDD